MAKKRTGLILLIVVAAAMLYPAYSWKMLQLEYQPELMGKMNCAMGELGVELFSDGIKLYTPEGGLMAYYKPESEGTEVISCCIADIEGDSAEELLIVEGNGSEFYGNRLVLLCYDNGLKKLYDREFKELNPWKIQICDVDGDGRKEIALGVYKKANFHPVMAKRPFLYHWEKGDIVPMWRGSRLSRPFDDYCFSDLDRDGKDELLAIEALPEGKELINAYSWKGFGFESIAESEAYTDITALESLRDDKGSLMIQISEGGRSRWILLEKANERLLEKVN